MLYKYGTTHEVCRTASRFPNEVFATLLAETASLDCEYGQDRDYTEIGGYSIVIEGKEDMKSLYEIINVDRHPCEWAMRLGTSGFICALYVLNNDFSIMLFIPESFTPASIIAEL